MDVTPTDAIAREIVTLSGSVPGTVRRPVAVQRETRSGWKSVERGTTTKKGRYSVRVRAARTPSVQTFRVLAPAARIGGHRWPAVVSPAEAVRIVGQRARLEAPSTSAVNKQWNLTATFRPARPERVVIFQQRTDGGWKRVARSVQDAAGQASAAMIGVTEGTFAYRAVAKRADGAKPSRSSGVEVTIEPDETVVSEDAVPLTPTDAAFVTDIDLTSGEVRFGPDAPPSVQNVEVGDVVALPPVDGAVSGALLQVTDRTVVGEETVLSTSQASLPDVVENVPDDQADVAMIPAAPVNVEPLGDPLDEFTVEDVDGAVEGPGDLLRARRQELGALAIKMPSKKITFEHTFTEKQGETTGQAVVSGTILLAPVVDLIFDADWGGVKSYKLGAGFKVSENLTMTGSLTQAKQWRRELFQVSAVQAGSLGPIPVWVQMTGTVELVVGAAGQASLTYTWDRSGEAVAGIAGDRTKGLFPPRPYRRTPMSSGELLAASATAAFGGTLVARGQYDIYSVAGAYAELGYEATVNVTQSTHQGLSCTFNHRPVASVGLSTGAALKTLTGVEHKLAKHAFPFKWRSTQLCPTPPPLPDPPVIATNALPDAVVGSPYDAALELEEPRNGTWALTDGQLPAGLALAADTGRITGTPTAAGAQIFTVAFTDEAGESAAAELSIDVQPEVTEPVGSTWRSVDGHDFTTCGVRRDDSGWCWGDNTYGQLGDGTTTTRLSPTSVPGSWRSIRTNGKSTCGIKTDGSGWCWGLNRYGQLGVDRDDDQYRPVQVEGAWRTIVPGESEATCGIRTDGTGWCWGSGAYGQIGDGGNTFRDVPSQVPGQWRSIQPGDGMTTCGIKTDGTGYCWGFNGDGQVGDGTTTARSTPTQLPGTWSSIDRGHNTTCGVQTDGSGWCWGENRLGQVGDGTEVDRTTPAQLPGTWQHVNADSNGSCGVRTDGTGWCWGHQAWGEVGDGTGTRKLTPTQVAGGGSWVSIERSEWLTCGLQTDESTWCWGMLGGSGGTQPKEVMLTPRLFSGSWSSVEVHHGTACGVTGDGTGWCWGFNRYGQVGDGTSLDSVEPRQLD